MRKLLLGSLAFCSLVAWAQENTFLSNDYWKKKPTITQVQQSIAQGNSPTQLNAHAFDATSLAILNDAPTEVITFLASLDGNGVDKLTHDKRTYLFWAASQGNIPVMKYLLSNGAKVNLTESHGLTPLLFAATRGRSNKEVYELLLKNGASISDTNSEGANALLLLIPHLSNLKQADFFVKKGLKLSSTDSKGNNAIYYAATTGNLPVIQALIKKKIKADQLNAQGENAIFGAARATKRSFNKLETFQFLESLGLNPNQKNTEGLSPLFILAGRNREGAVISYFLEKGNNPTQTNKEGRTPLMNAAALNTPEVASLLLEAANNINQQDKEGRSALTLAIENNKIEMIDLLLSKGADTQVLDREGNTLYHYAVKRADVKILERLASSPSLNINQKNAEGLTPLHKAVMLGKNLEVVQFLLSKGANKQLTTDLGETAYDLAQENEVLKEMNIDFLK